MRRLIILLVCQTASWAQLQPSLLNSTHSLFNTVTQKGDTWRCSGWSPSTAGGNWNGGHLYCTFNDGAFVASGNRNLAIWELTAYDPNNIANSTFALVNAMTSYGAAGTGGLCGALTYKSQDVWSDGGKLYWNQYCQTNGSPFDTFQSWISVSPDKGLHWCNFAHYVTGGNGGANTCDAGNWGATGDVPTGATATDMQWQSLGTFTKGSTMGRLAPVQVVQDGVAMPTLPGGLSNAFHYVLSVGETSDDISHMYLHRYSGDPMLPANWTHYNAGTWDTNPQNATILSPPAVPQAVSAIYSADMNNGSGGFLLTAYNNVAYPLWQSTDLVSWTALPATLAYSVDVAYEFPTFMLPTYATIVAGKSFSISQSLNGHDIGGGCTTTWCYVLGFSKIVFNPPNATAGARIGQ